MMRSQDLDRQQVCGSGKGYTELQRLAPVNMEDEEGTTCCWVLLDHYNRGINTHLDGSMVIMPNYSVF
jgi:hypothetical protein